MGKCDTVDRVQFAHIFFHPILMHILSIFVRFYLIGITDLSNHFTEISSYILYICERINFHFICIVRSISTDGKLMIFTLIYVIIVNIKYERGKKIKIKDPLMCKHICWVFFKIKYLNNGLRWFGAIVVIKWSTQ